MINKLKKFEAEFKAQFPGCWYRIGDFYGDNRTVFWSGEDNFAPDTLPLFDYEATIHVDEIHPKLAALTEKHGFFWECYDPGTYHLTEY